jgi:hypothetical protein
MHPVLEKALFMTVVALFSCYGLDTASCRFPVKAQFAEESITLEWDDVPGASGYNIYADYGNGPERVNFSRIVSRNRFVLMRAGSNGKKERIVKGNRVECRVVPLKARIRKGDTTYTEGPALCPVRNDFFRGFSAVLSDSSCARVLEKKQFVRRTLPASASVPAAAFCSTYARLARGIHEVYTSLIDPKDEGACVPFSTMVAKYFTAKGVPCFRAQGVFIGSFHSFNLVVVDSVEYVLDFTANQYVPGSAPVFMPRDFCFVDSCGTPTSHPAGMFTRLYGIEKVYAADQITFTETPKAKGYQQTLDSLMGK